MAQLKINRGTTYTLSVNYQRNGEAATLVGATVRFTMKSAEYSTDTTDADAALKKDVTNGTADGVASIEITPGNTKDLAPGKYFYDIKVQEASGAIYKIDEGTIKLDASPTNRTA